MRIKEVCERTGLTDRAIRYYIDAALLSPEYSENYLGRKNYSFSEEDIASLNEVLVLRNIGFSVPEIATIQKNPEKIAELVSALSKRTTEEFEKDRGILAILSRLELSRIHNISELADAVTALESVSKSTPPGDETHWSDRILLGCKTVLVAVLTWLPILYTIVGYLVSYRRKLYPNFGNERIIEFLIPSICMFFTPLLRRFPKIKRWIRAVLLILCALSLPLLRFWAISGIDISQTDSRWDYREFDKSCPANHDIAFQNLFPVEDGWYFSDMHYYYRFEETVFGDHCEIYAEMSLKDEKFADETARVSKLLTEENACWDDCGLVVWQQEDFTCYLRYQGTAPISTEPEMRPYSDGRYYLFAYDPASNTVRYLYFYTDIGKSSTGYYNTLKWTSEPSE